MYRIRISEFRNLTLFYSLQKLPRGKKRTFLLSVSYNVLAAESKIEKYVWNKKTKILFKNMFFKNQTQPA